VKITKARLKEIISEELEELLVPPGTPRIASLSPRSMPTSAPVEDPPETKEALRDRLWNMVTSYIEVSGKDPSVPGHVLHAFNRLAQEIAKG
tara:strand:- start:1108 stop:1383 length:276 start_codon:yes stop_codon:yes gene_type:complete